MPQETNQHQQTPGVEEAPTYFELNAYSGATKHMGGLSTTRELIELCSIDQHSYVLEVGCGTGATSRYLAQKVGCRVLGVDIRPSMIEQARERAARAGVQERAEFRVADATALPFENSTFDAVLVESVTTFIEHKAAAIREYARVVKPGGCVGLNEELWHQAPVPPEIVEYVAFTWDVRAEIPTLEGWIELLTASGLTLELASRRRYAPVTDLSEIARYGCRDFLTIFWRSAKLYFTSPAFRKYMRERRRLPKGIWDYLGYALLVGRK
ncbi:MAG: methyltransferase domain-containing protein [Anaerolineae bacterium]|nr:methyltransferase domain-containing protein [Anaerolineae bacterium]